MNNTELIRQCEEMLNADAPPSALAVGYLLRRVIPALRRAQPSEKPLTLDELRGMDGEPVYYGTAGIWLLVYIEHPDFGDCLVDKRGLYVPLQKAVECGTFRSRPKEEV